VGTHHADALAALDLKIEALEQGSGISFREVPRIDDHVAGAVHLAEAHVRTVDRANRFDTFDARQLLLAVLGLLSPLACAVLADLGLEISDLLGLALGLALEPLGPLAP